MTSEHYLRRYDSMGNFSNDIPDDEEAVASMEHLLTNEVQYLSTIRNHKRSFKSNVFEIEIPWQELKIKPCSRNQLDMLVHANTIKNLLDRMESCLRYLNGKHSNIFKACIPAEDSKKLYNLLKIKRKETKKSVIGTDINVQMHSILQELSESRYLEDFFKSLPRKLQDKKLMKLTSRFNKLYKAMEPTLVLTAKELVQKRKRLWEVEKNYRSKRSMIKFLNNKMKEAYVDNSKRIKIVDMKIQDLKMKMVNLHAQKKNVINYIQSTSAKAMLHRGDASEELTNKLELQAAGSTEYYEKLLADHLKIETALRMSRGKIESKLVSVLNKYDTVMTEEQTIFDEISELYYKELGEFMELECLHEEQSKKYNTFREMYEKEEEEHKERTNAFMVLRATKIIQAWWREKLKRIRQLRKKNRKNRIRFESGTKSKDKKDSKKGKSKKSR